MSKPYDPVAASAWWTGVIAARLAGAPESGAEFARGVVHQLDDLQPQKPPQRPGNVPPVGTLESQARDGRQAGPWLDEFLAWRDEVTHVEASNASALETVFSAAIEAAKAGRSDLATRCTRFAVEVYGFRGAMPSTVAEAKAAAAKITTRPDLLPMRLRWHRWERPMDASRGGKGVFL
jgi:hypothetical protein